VVLEVTAKTLGQKVQEIYKKQVIFMPHPGRFGRGKEMGRGPYEKCGLLRETSLPPLRPVKKTFEIPFPYKDTTKNGKKWRELLADELEIDVKIWYVPYGEFDGNEVLFFHDTKKVDLKTEWVWRN